MPVITCFENMRSDFIHGNVDCTGRISFFSKGAAMFILVGKENTGEKNENG